MSALAEFVAEHEILLALIEKILSEPEEASTAPTKSATESARLRNLGNISYSSQQIDDALNYYNQSIAVAPAESEELALAFGNRSAVLFSLRKYEFCLFDINRALKGLMPERSKPKLLRRKMDCWAELEAENELKSSFLEGRCLISPNEPLDASAKRFFQIKKMSIDDSDFVPDCDDPIWNVKLDNPFLPNVSSKVKLDYNSKWGQHLVATSNIATGEILAMPNLFATRTSHKIDRSYKHCAHCTVWCVALIPCSSCTLQMYCSEHCRREAYDSYHRTECKILPLLSSFSVDQENALLAVRMFLIGTKQGSELTSLMNDSNVEECLAGKRKCVGVPCPNDYLAILNLPWKNIDENDCWVSSVVVGLATDKVVSTLFVALRRSNFFENDAESFQSLTDAELFAALLLCHHVSLLRYNLCGLYVEYIGHEGDGYEKQIGIGIDVFLRHINHRCDPNVAMQNDKQRYSIFSTRPIKAGEQIFMSYCFNFSKRPREWRRETLKSNHNLVCRCKACVEDWPLAVILIERNDVFLTTDKRIIRDVNKMHKWMLSLCLSPTITTIYEIKSTYMRKVIAFVETYRKYTKEPSPTMFMCGEFVINCMRKKANCYSILTTVKLIDYLSKFRI